MILIGHADPDFRAEIFFVDKIVRTTGYGWQCWVGKEIAFQGGAWGTQKEAINQFESFFADEHPDAGKWKWQTVEDSFEPHSAKGEKSTLINRSWELIENSIGSLKNALQWNDVFLTEDELKTKLKFELEFIPLLKVFAASNNLIPQRWADGKVTWLKNPVGVPCNYCGAKDAICVDSGIDFPGQSDYAKQLLCGCGAAGPHAENEQDAISRWNELMGSDRHE